MLLVSVTVGLLQSLVNRVYAAVKFARTFDPDVPLFPMGSAFIKSFRFAVVSVDMVLFIRYSFLCLLKLMLMIRCMQLTVIVTEVKEISYELIKTLVSDVAPERLFM